MVKGKIEKRWCQQDIENKNFETKTANNIYLVILKMLRNGGNTKIKFRCFRKKLLTTDRSLSRGGR